MSSVTRSIDRSGRIVIPKEALRTLNWPTGTKILVSADCVEGQNVIILTKSTSVCHLCSGPLTATNHITIDEKPICNTCIDRITTLRRDSDYAGS